MQREHIVKLKTVLFLGFLFAGLTCSSGQADELPLGIVKEKPQSGRFVKTDKGYMVAYKATIPGTDVQFEMILVAGGEFLLGSPENEKDRSASEGPQIKVKVKPFWMGKYEVRWKEYDEYMALDDRFEKFESKKLRLVTKQNEIDEIGRAHV